MVIQSVEKFPMDNHDPLTRAVMARLGQSILSRSQGGDCPQELADEAKRFRLAMLDEGAGEGVHRATAHEKDRAPASGVQHVKQSSRERAAIERASDFLEAHGERGRSVFRYEWSHWKRIVNPNPQSRWRNVKWKPKQALERFYREDDFAQQDWSGIAFRESGPVPDAAEDLTEDARINNEYLSATFTKGQHYSVRTSASAVDADGARVDVPEDVFVLCQ